MASRDEASASLEPKTGTAAAASNSRLAQMKMRFQQKQMHEREQRRLELTGGGAATKTVASETNVRMIGNGKVRQMFDERRRGAGIDRSNPLKPLANTTVGQTRSTVNTRSVTTLPKSKTTLSNSTKSKVFSNSVPAKPIANGPKRTTTRESNNNPFASNGSINLDEYDMICNETFPKEISSLSLSRGMDDMNNNKRNIKKNEGLMNGSNRLKTPPQSGSIRLNPLVTKKSPSVAKPLAKSSASTPTVKSPPTRGSAGGRLNLSKNPPKASYPMHRPKKDQDNRNETPPEGTAKCRYCQRHFNVDRLGKHEEICFKMINTKRRVFDATKHRVKGTDAEKFVKKSRPVGPSGNLTKPPAYMSAAQLTGVSVGVRKNNWRQKHEEFISAIRAAKQVKAHLDRGGKLSDLPPPPPSENPDYIQCPHCLRRFNQAAAERHIPKCATMLHNKPKPGTQPPRRRM